MTFSKRLKHARERKGMTLAELGKRIGKTEATVQRYESGNIKNLKNETIELIAKTLNINPAYLMGWTDNIDHTIQGAEETTDYNPVKNNHVETIAAHIDDDVTEEQMKDIIKYIEFIKNNKF